MSGVREDRDRERGEAVEEAQGVMVGKGGGGGNLD